METGSGSDLKPRAKLFLGVLLLLGGWAFIIYGEDAYYNSEFEGEKEDLSVNVHEDSANDELETGESQDFEGGYHTATVDYYNPETGHSATYTLDVEVEDGQVVQIDFPKGGWLDEDHISPAELDEFGYAEVEGEDGKTYEVQIDY